MYVRACRSPPVKGGDQVLGSFAPGYMRDTGFDFVRRSPFVQMQAAGEVVRRPIVVERASFVLVSEFGSGAYSAKRSNGATRRFTGFSHGWLPSSVKLSLLKSRRNKC